MPQSVSLPFSDPTPKGSGCDLLIAGGPRALMDGPQRMGWAQGEACVLHFQLSICSEKLKLHAAFFFPLSSLRRGPRDGE